MAKTPLYQAVKNLDGDLEAFLTADLPIKAVTIADLAEPGMSSLVTAAKQAASLKRTLWTVQRGSVLDMDPYNR